MINKSENKYITILSNSESARSKSPNSIQKHKAHLRQQAEPNTNIREALCMYNDEREVEARRQGVGNDLPRDIIETREKRDAHREVSDKDGWEERHVDSFA